MKEIIKKITDWAKSEKHIRGLALVGSYARGVAKKGSDIDFIIITDHQSLYLDREEWVEQFGKVREIKKEDYGLVQSKRVFYLDGNELEFGITSPEWTKVDPIDEGTKKVVIDGLKILYDKDGLFGNLLEDLKIDT